VVGGRDHHERALEILGPVLATLPADGALGGKITERLDRLGRHQRDVAVAGQQPLDLLEAHIAAAHHQAPAAAEPQACDVEGGLEHALHAALVADPLPEMADAFLAGIGLSGHGVKV
jgi:hypothetical protein